MRIYLNRLLFLLFFLGAAVSLSAQQSPPPDRPSESEDPKTINTYALTVYPNPKAGKVLLFDERGTLVKTGATGKVITDIPRFSGTPGDPYRPFTYNIKIIADEHFFTCWIGEQLHWNDPGRIRWQQEFTLTPPQSKAIRWTRVLTCLFLVLGSSAALVLRVKIRQKLWELRETKRQLEEVKTEAVTMGKMPQRVGNYRMLEKIGDGGMASVYKVVDRFGDIYALKIPHAHVFTIPEYRERFIREAEIIKMLNHPNIVRMYDYSLGEDYSIPYICLEYVTGATLKQYLTRHPDTSKKSLVGIVIQVAEALRYAHSKGIIHRDVKPENVMITSKNEIKLMDLGIAKQTQMPGVTATGISLGTPYYMPPEQIESRPVDGRADLYSLGAMLYEMLTGKPPFDADSPIEIAVKHLTEEPPAPSSLQPTIPKKLDAVILKLLEKDPARRYQSAAELIEVLGGFQ